MAALQRNARLPGGGTLLIALNRAIDGVVEPIIGRLTNERAVFASLYIEYRALKKYSGIHRLSNSESYTLIDHLWFIYPQSIERAQALVGHISIMLSLSAVLLALIVAFDSVPVLLILAAAMDLIFKAFVMVLSLRSLRAHGLYNSYQSVGEFRRGFWREIAHKYSLLMLINTLSVFGIFASVALVIATILSH